MTTDISESAAEAQCIRLRVRSQWPMSETPTATIGGVRERTQKIAAVV